MEKKHVVLHIILMEHADNKLIKKKVRLPTSQHQSNRNTFYSDC
jgi:hypothetical protein